MKIYANRGNYNKELLDSVVGLDLWVPVGWEDEFYGWVKILSYLPNDNFWYRSELIRMIDVIRCANQGISWQTCVKKYNFPATHFEDIDISWAVATEDLAEEFAVFVQGVQLE